MKLDNLKALIKLANNNLNDNEANLAARRVCKILAKDNFALLKNPLWQPSKAQEDFVNDPRPRTWNDVKRPTEPQWRQWTDDGRDYDNFADFIRHYGGAAAGGKTKSYDAETKGRWGNPETGKNWTDDAPHVNVDDHEEDWVNYNPGIKDPPKYDAQGKRIREQELRKCTKCGLEIMTFRIKENPWICNPCQWKDAF